MHEAGDDVGLAHLRREYDRALEHYLTAVKLLKRLGNRSMLVRLARNLGEFIPAITDIDAPQTAHGIEHLDAFGVPDVNALATRHDAGATAGQVLEVGERMQEVGVVERLNARGVGRGVHGGIHH